MPAATGLLLASTSPYRRELLARLCLPFDTVSPRVDETPQAGELPHALVQRLSEAKARAGATQRPGSLVIGSDQLAVIDGEILGKPGSHAAAHAQLSRLSGQVVTFLTGLALFNHATGRMQSDVVPFQVHFRSLTGNQIEHYLEREQPYDCAGSFRSEGLGIALFERMEGDDPTALIGLPLIRLVEMLENEGVEVI